MKCVSSMLYSSSLLIEVVLSTRVGSVVISNGAYLIVVAIAVLIETIGTVMIPKQQDDQH